MMLEGEEHKTKDQITDYIGHKGRWQIIFISAILTFYVSVAYTWQVLVMTFYSPPLDFMCQPTVVTDDGIDYESYTYAQWQEIAKQFNNVKYFCC